MVLDDAMKSHAEWKIKFRMAIAHQEKMDDVSISKDDCCHLGQWLIGDGKSHYGTLPEFRDLVAKHKAFHADAGKIARLINAGSYAEAEQAIGVGSSYASASNGVVLATMALKKAVGL